jgi:hypothetical protein
VEIGLLKDKEGHFTRTPQETLALLMNTHFPECKDATPLNEEPDQPWSWTILDENHPVVKPEEVAKSFGPMKSPGPDTIYPIALRELPHDMVELIARIYTACASRIDIHQNVGAKTRSSLSPSRVRMTMTYQRHSDQYHYRTSS